MFLFFLNTLRFIFVFHSSCMCVRAYALYPKSLKKHQEAVFLAQHFTQYLLHYVTAHCENHLALIELVHSGSVIQVWPDAHFAHPC